MLTCVLRELHLSKNQISAKKLEGGFPEVNTGEKSGNQLMAYVPLGHRLLVDTERLGFL